MTNLMKLLIRIILRAVDLFAAGFVVGMILWTIGKAIGVLA